MAGRRGPGLTRVVLLHGFTQTGASWRRLAEGLSSEGHDVVAPDLPGHGAAADLRLDLRATAAWLADEVGPGCYVGYSMGGRVALHVALDHPDAVERLALLGASPGLRDPAEREARRRSDEELAASLERDGVPAFLDRWLAQPLFAGLPDDPDERAARLANPPAGLAASLRLSGTGTQEPLWDRLPELRAPVLLLAGERDARFAGLAREAAAVIGRPARVALVGGAGHAAHLERPAEVLRLLSEFLRG